jgi:hypothetical protein
VQSVVEVKRLSRSSPCVLDASQEGLSLFGTDLDVGFRTGRRGSDKAWSDYLSAKTYEVARELPSAVIEFQADPT